MIGHDKVQMLEQAIMEIAHQEAQTILKRAQAEADSICKQAQRDADRESARIRQEAQQKVAQTLEQAVAKARLEAQMLILQRREQLLTRTFDEVRQRLSTLPQRADYAAIVQNLIGEAVTWLGGEAFVICADAVTDQVLTDAFLADLAQKLKVRLERGPVLETGTGIILSTPDGHRRYDNTLETRLSRLQDSLRTAVYHILAGAT